MAVCLAVGWGPYAFGSDPALTYAPPGPVADGLARLIAEAGVPAEGVRLSRDPTFDADVTGGFGRARVVVGPQVLGWPAPDARAYVGHLMGHYAHTDVFVVFLLYGLVAFAALVAVQRWAAPLARWLGARQATAAADADAAPAAALILVVALGVAMLAATGYLRWANVRADAFSLDHAREPDGLASVLVRTWDHESVDPNPIETAIFYSHPPLSARLTHAMCWKTTHGN
jgi:STE24 endopeptidase